MALPVNGASKTCPSLKSHQTGDPHRCCSPYMCFKHCSLVSKVVKSATCLPNCTVSSLSRCHPSWRSVQTQEAPPGRAGKVLGYVQPANLTMHPPGKCAVLCCRAGSSASRSPAAPKGRVWLRQAGSGTCERQGMYPVSLHGLASMCTAVRWNGTGSSCPVPVRLVPPLLPGELLRPVK